MPIRPFVTAAALFISAGAAAASASDTAFLDFPYVDSISAAKVPAFAWLVRQADKSTLVFAAAPGFRRIELASRSDIGGDPISQIQLSPDGAHLAYLTGVPRPGEPFNPGSAVPAPKVQSVAHRHDLRGEAGRPRDGFGPELLGGWPHIAVQA